MIKKFISTLMVVMLAISILTLPASAITTDTHSGASVICDDCGEKLAQCEVCNAYYHSTQLTECPQTIEHIKSERFNDIIWIVIGILFFTAAIGLIFYCRKEKETTSKAVLYIVVPLFCIIACFILATSIICLVDNITLLNQY